MREIVRPAERHLTSLIRFFLSIDTPEIRRHFSPHPFTEERARALCGYTGRDEYWLAMEGDEVAAYGMLRGWDEGYDVPSLGICVAPAYQGRGVAGPLMERLLATARARGAKRVILKVNRDNARAIALYRRMGFELTSQDETYLKGTLALVELTCLITTIDEAPNLRVLIPELRRKLDGEGVAYEILVVDGPSTDGTEATARELGCRVEKQSGPGYAQAIRDGIRHARGNFLIVMDADGSHAPEDVVRLYRERHRADIVINSRYVPGGASATGPWRSGLSRLLNFGYRLVLGLPYREISGGFRIYRREILTRFELESKFYEVQEELLIKPHWLGYRAVEIPYTYRDRLSGESKARLLTYGWHLMLALLRFRLARRGFRRRHAPAPK